MRTIHIHLLLAIASCTYCIRGEDKSRLDNIMQANSFPQKPWHLTKFSTHHCFNAQNQMRKAHAETREGGLEAVRRVCRDWQCRCLHDLCPTGRSIQQAAHRTLQAIHYPWTNDVSLRRLRGVHQLHRQWPEKSCEHILVFTSSHPAVSRPQKSALIFAAMLIKQDLRVPW